MEKDTTIIGLYARKETIAVALAEAGQRGYGIQRQRTLAGHGCRVVAPSLIQRTPGDRIKTDRRDAVDLAKLNPAGELTPVWVPDP